MEDLHLFYVESNFHLILAESIIAANMISPSKVLFVTHRGVKLSSVYKNRLLYDGTNSHFKDRVQMYKNNKKYYSELLANKRIYSYLPFQFLFPAIHYYFSYNLLEEGFSAYSVSRIMNNRKGLKYELFKALYINLLFPFANKNIKGFLMGVSASSHRSLKKTTLYVSNREAYNNYKFGGKVEKQVVSIISNQQSSIRGQKILVMDRLSKKGRPFDDKTYLLVLKEVFSKLNLNNQNILVKLHPADVSSDINSRERVSKTFGELGIIPMFINDNLEELALSNNNNIFIGTNSTILYYAPIFGKTNKSISFSRILADADKQYSQFLERWGGCVAFCNIFSKQVECL